MGCEADLSGRYSHREHPSFQYVATDDGRSLRLDVQRIVGDAGIPEGGGSDQWIELLRTGDGFLGATHAIGFAANGAECPVRFPTRVEACDEGGLVLRTAVSVAIDESCRASPRPASSEAAHRLLRVRPGDG